MRIVGFNFKKISGERKKELKGQLKINTGINVKDISKEKLDFIGDSLKIYYLFTVDYSPDFAKISLEGEVLAVPDDFKKIFKEWRNKKIPDEFRIPLFNFIMSKCNLKALHMEEEFNLPPHIPLPQLKPENQQQQGKANYAG